MTDAPQKTYVSHRQAANNAGTWKPGLFILIGRARYIVMTASDGGLGLTYISEFQGAQCPTPEQRRAVLLSYGLTSFSLADAPAGTPKIDP